MDQEPGSGTGLSGPRRRGRFWRRRGFKTGDIAEQLANGSVKVFGRKKELINVGGEKVLPAEVERVLLAHPSVADCRVRAEKNALAGQIVAADVVWCGEERDPIRVKRSLHEFARNALSRHKLPAVVRLVPAIEYTHNMKKARAVAS